MRRQKRLLIAGTTTVAVSALLTATVLDSIFPATRHGAVAVPATSPSTEGLGRGNDERPSARQRPKTVDPPRVEATAGSGQLPEFVDNDLITIGEALEREFNAWQLETRSSCSDVAGAADDVAGAADDVSSTIDDLASALNDLKTASAGVPTPAAMSAIDEQLAALTQRRDVTLAAARTYANQHAC